MEQKVSNLLGKRNRTQARLSVTSSTGRTNRLVSDYPSFI
jgi:hypothetical protein